MNKREFLAVGGATPLMLAGCGGSGAGSAPVRLVNASVGYPNLGFMVGSTQATSADVAYGSASPFENVQAGSVSLTLTVAGASATASQTRTINKGTRYSLIAYGYADELKSVLVTESTTTPDTGKANVNALNTSVDIGPVDVYLSTTKDLAVSTQIATSLAGVSQSAFSGVLAGSYYITVVGAGTKGLTDVRFQTNAAVVLTAQEVLTVVLTPGASGILANAILLTQGTAAAANPTVNQPNTTARIRAVTATNGLSTTITGVDSTGKAITILPASTVSQPSNYFVTTTTALPTVTVNGAQVTPFMIVNGAQAAAALSAGGDYTLMVYLDGSGNPIAQIIEDNNTAPTLAQGVKYRLINLASDNQGLSLSMTVNSQVVASQVAYGTASDYTELSTPQNVTSVVTVFNGTTTIAKLDPQLLTLGKIFTDIVTSVPASGAAGNFFLASK
jgi:hypothetical protein